MRRGIVRLILWRFLPGLLLLEASIGNCVAPVTPREPDIRQRGRLAEIFLQDKLALWQRRLHLQDWTIFIVTARSDALRPRTLGNIRWDATKKTASIRVLDASEYRMPFHSALNDMEFTIVHELMHLTLSSLPRSEASRSEEEYAINRIAKALVQVDREN